MCLACQDPSHQATLTVSRNNLHESIASPIETGVSCMSNLVSEEPSAVLITPYRAYDAVRPLQVIEAKLPQRVSRLRRVEKRLDPYACLAIRPQE